jgi:high-affinity nickel permease
MLGLDDWIAAFSDEATLGLVVLVAVLLGLRHATDPDHLAAMTALIAGGRDRAARAAAKLGFAWGVGHGATLLAFGLPVVVYREHLPERLQQAAETAVAVVIGYLAIRLLLRWRRGEFHLHAHTHDTFEHSHVHAHAAALEHGHQRATRSPLGAFGVGLIHGMGGSAGVSVLLLASIRSTAVAVTALAVLAVFTAISMTILTGGFGLMLGSRPVRSAFGIVAPALGTASLAFGVWYAGAAWSAFPYPF